jgi:hypothetical protein
MAAELPDPIVDVIVTHSEVAPEGFTLACKIKAKVNGRTGYLWTKRGKFGALTAIRVDHGACDTSDFMYGNVETQLNPDGYSKAYLAFQCGEGSPIIDIMLHEGDMMPPSGYSKHHRDVYRSTGVGTKKAYLAYKTQESAKYAQPVVSAVQYGSGVGAGAGSPAVGAGHGAGNIGGPQPVPAAPQITDEDIEVLKTLKVGDFLDARDSVPKWCMSELVNRSGNNFQVHYSGWPSRYDEWIELRAGRLAPYVAIFFFSIILLLAQISKIHIRPLGSKS